MSEKTNIELYDINPVHLIRECLINNIWGMGYPVEDLDNDSFVYAADVLYEEEFGLSFVWDDSGEIQDFITEILRHIDAAIYIDYSGKFILKLIRDDYNIEDLRVFGPEEIIEVNSYEVRTQTELINTLTLTYKDGYTNKEISITIHDLALIQAQGGVIINKDVNMLGITKSKLANKVALRELKSYSTELAKVTFTVNRWAHDVNVGDVFLFNWPDYGLEQVVMRVISISYGTLKDGKIVIDCLQDHYSIADSVYTEITDTLWKSPKNIEPIACSKRVIMEMPYYQMVQLVSESETVWNDLNFDDDSSVVMYGASRPLNSAYHYLLTSKVEGENYKTYGAKDFIPYAVLGQDIHKDSYSFTLSEISEDIGKVSINSYAVIGDELMKVDGFMINPPRSMYAYRGVLDTTPKYHYSGETIFFINEFFSSDFREYASGETVYMGARTVTNAAILKLSDTPKDSIYLKGRLLRPYPPGDFKINDLMYPFYSPFGKDIVISWAHRNRIQQTGDIVPQWEGDIGPEGGTTYTIQIFDENDILIREESGIIETSYTYTKEQEKSDSGMDRVNIQLRIKLFSVRDGLESFDYHEHTIHRSAIFIIPSAHSVSTGYAVDWVAGIE